MEKHQNIARVRDEELKRKAARALQEIGMHVLSQSPFLLVQRPRQVKNRVLMENLLTKRVM